jgi:alpha-glucosidase
MRRARAASLLCAALPGSLYIYQGDELGLEEVQDLPEGQRQDPMHLRSGGSDPGRDGCRVPIPWSGRSRPFGFSPDDASAEPWLRQPTTWSAKAVEAQLGDPDSMLNLYRDVLRIRRLDPDLGDGPLRWLDGPSGVLAFARGDDFVALTNISGAWIPLPMRGAVLLASTDLDDRGLPPDASAWLRIEPDTLARSLGWPTREAE